MPNENLSTIMWKENQTVLLSTNSDLLNDGKVTYKTGKSHEEIKVPCPWVANEVC